MNPGNAASVEGKPMNCGECLINDVEIVPLLNSGLCPRCGTDYSASIGNETMPAISDAVTPIRNYCDCESCDGYVIHASEAPYCPSCYRERKA